MQSINSLPFITTLMKEGKYDKALGLIDKSAEILVPLLKKELSQNINTDPISSLILAKAHLLLGNYTLCVHYALIAKDHLKNLEPFYYESILFHMMNHLVTVNKKENESLRNKNINEIRELKAFILDVIKNDPLDDSLLGFLTEIREFDLLKKKIVELSKSDVNCRELIDSLLDIGYEDFCDAFLACSIENPAFLEYIIDAYVFQNRVEDLIKFVLNLPWDKMYSACFYIEDTYPKMINESGWTPENSWKREITSILKNSNSQNAPYMQNVEFILSGEWKKEIMSHFLMKNSKTSFKFLEAMSKNRAPFISLCNSIMNAGTTNDTLYRNNKGVLTGREWTRFIEYSCIGMVHYGNTDGFEILKEILPSIDSSNGEPGALMALGAMSAGSGDPEITDFLLNWIENSSDELVFGACMGIGLNMLEQEDPVVAEKLKSLFSIDSTISQESALYAISMIYAGSGNRDVIDFIYMISEKTDFPRVKRVCGVAMSLVTILNDPEDNVFSMLKSSDAFIRSAALLSLGSSYTATADLTVIKNILPFINDGDDDTKRAAVIALALIGYLDPVIKTSVLIPLAQNHNPHVRGAVALSLGLFNSGLGDLDVTALLEAMLYDSDDIVRQCACIGAGFALVQMNPDLVPNYKRTLDKMNLIIASKGESNCAKIGASIGRSIAEVGGRSAIFSLKNHVGQLDGKRVAGAILFLNSFYWYPLLGCMSLMILPTPIFFFNSNLEHTSDIFKNDPKFYDYLVRIPEIRRSRRFKVSTKPSSEVSDKKTDAPRGLASGDRITMLEMMEKSIENSIFFKE